MSTLLSRSAKRSPRRNLAKGVGLVVVAPVVLTACGTGVSAGPGATATSGATVTITNCGRKLAFDAAPPRIVGMAPSQTELLLRVGARDRIVAQAQTATSALPDDVADQAADIPVVSTDAPPAREDLLAVDPAFVVSPTEYEFTAEKGFAGLDQLAANGAQAYVATGGCADRRNTAEVTDLFTDITNLGDILRVPDAADRLVADGKTRLDAVTRAIHRKERPTVAQIYVEGNTLGVIGAGVEADIIRQAGGKNVFDPDAPEFTDFFATQINPEELIARSPEAIVFGSSGPAQEKQIRGYLKKTFPSVPAVRKDVVIAVPQSDLYPGTLGNIDAVETIAARLHPESF